MTRQEKIASTRLPGIQRSAKQGNIHFSNGCAACQLVCHGQDQCSVLGLLTRHWANKSKQSPTTSLTICACPVHRKRLPLGLDRSSFWQEADSEWAIAQRCIFSVCHQPRQKTQAQFYSLFYLGLDKWPEPSLGLRSVAQCPKQPALVRLGPTALQSQIEPGIFMDILHKTRDSAHLLSGGRAPQYNGDIRQSEEIFERQRSGGFRLGHARLGLQPLGFLVYTPT